MYVHLAPAHNGHAIIACTGPSLADTINDLKSKRDETGGVVVSISGSHNFLIQHDIIPDFHVERDLGANKAANVIPARAETQYLINSGCHPYLFDKLVGYNVKLWHASTEHVDCDARWKIPNTESMSTGLCAIPLFYAQGYREFSLFAMDCSFKGVVQHAGVHIGKWQEVFNIEHNGRIYPSSPTLLTFIVEFESLMRKMTDIRIRLYGEGLLQVRAKDCGLDHVLS